MDYFNEVLKFTMKWEGGFVNNPNDPGGATNKGVTQAVYDEYRFSKDLPLRSVMDILSDEVNDIYKTRYWFAGKCDKLPVPLCLAHFDTAVNCGVTGAAKILQRSLNVPDDGVIGPVTLAAASIGGVSEYLEERKAHYANIIAANPKLKTFEKGWMSRVMDLERFCVKYI